MKLSFPLITCVTAALALTACGSSSNNKFPKSPVSSSSSSIESSSSSSSSSVPAEPSWKLVWSDEFEGDELDLTKWGHEVTCWGGGNAEGQCYTNDPKNSYVRNGLLHIVAERERVCGPAHNQEDPAYNPEDVSACKPYSSARLRTRDKGDWKYGRMEIRAKMPFGKGLWPAIWALPTENIYGGWPHSGEIDIFEIFAPGHADPIFPELNEIHGTLHYGFSWPWNNSTGKGFTPSANVWEEFFTYAIEWEEGEIRWFVDDTHYATQTSDGWFTYYWGGQSKGYQVGTGAQPFDQAFHLILNVAVGSEYFLAFPDDDAEFPQSMQVEYVRVYQCDADPETGKGCGTSDPSVEPVVGHASPADERDVVTLFNNGVTELELKGKTILLEPGYYSADNAVQSNPALVDGDQVVWDIVFNGDGSAFMTAIGGLDLGDAVYGRVKNAGEIRFDLRVLSIDENAGLRVKVDSGWPRLSLHEIEVPTLNEWTEVAVRFYTLQDNDIESGAVFYKNVINPFLIEAVRGKAHVQVNNVRIVCHQAADAGCDIGAASTELPGPDPEATTLTETFTVFDGKVDALWNHGIDHWQSGAPHVVTGIVDAIENERGKVIDVKFTSASNNGIMFIQSTVPHNASALSAGHLSFDIKVLNYGSNQSGLVVKADCVNPCSSGDIEIGKVGDGQWETVTIPVADLIAGGLNPNRVDTPFVILPVWGDQYGVHLQLDNIKWVLP